MVYIKEFHKFRRKAKIITFNNMKSAEEYLKIAKGTKWYVYETEKSYQADSPDQLIFNMKVKHKKHREDIIL